MTFPNQTHAYVQYVYNVAAKYKIFPSKAVVGVDRLTKALSMHIQKPYKGKSQLSFCHKIFFNQTPSCICSMFLLYRQVDRHICIYKSLIREIFSYVLTAVILSKVIY